MSFLPKFSTIFHYGTWSCDSVTYNLPLIPNFSSKNRIDWKKKKRKRKVSKIESNLYISNIIFAFIWILLIHSSFLSIFLLQSIPWECNIEMGWGYDDIIGYAKVVSVSTLCSKCSSLTISLLSPHIFWLINFMDYIWFPYVYHIYII